MIRKLKVTSRSSPGSSFMPFTTPHPATAVVYLIGEAARLSGVSTANIRYYEKEKLLSAHGRGDNSYRMYSKQTVHELRFIRLCRAMDMSLDEVRTLLGLDLANKTHCATARTALDAHLGHVRERLAELKLLEQDLKGLRERCDGTGATCNLIEALHAQADDLSASLAPLGKLPAQQPVKRRVTRHV